MSLSKALYPLLSTGLTQEDPSWHDSKIIDWDVIIKTNKQDQYLMYWFISSIFQTDKGFDKGIFYKQMSVMRGQVIV